MREFQALDLRCHALLHDVPLHDAWVVELDGGGPGRTMRDVHALRERRGPPASRAVRTLFALRFALGRFLGWDGDERNPIAESYVHRLTDDDRARSLVTPGTPHGRFRTLYLFPDESLLEVQNATVHAFLAMALRPRADGYTLHWGIYVQPVGKITRLYMAVIDPFRRWIVYPALIRDMRTAWARTYLE